jgi:hypothetical protein
MWRQGRAAELERKTETVTAILRPLLEHLFYGPP